MIKKQAIIALTLTIFIVSALFVNVSSAATQTTLTIQSSGAIKAVAQENPTDLTVILRGICITSLNPSTMNISSWVDSYVDNHSYANAITLGDMHQYGIWWYGFTFSNTHGTWMGWTFQQLKTLIDRFHYHGWTVGLESTGIAWDGQEEYTYISEEHPELAFTDAHGMKATGVDNTTALTKNPGDNKVIPDFFAKFATTDNTNNIPKGTRVIDLYTSRLGQMINDGLTWDFWFGTDGWNGFDIQDYLWNSETANNCYSFSTQEIDEYSQWTTLSLPDNWASVNQTQKANIIISNQTFSDDWWYYWQMRFAQMYSQIKQVFITQGRTGPYYLIGSADLSSQYNGGNLGPKGMYNMSLLAEFNSVDYYYVDVETGTYVGADYGGIPKEAAYAAAAVKTQNPELTPIIGLQLVDWLGNPEPLWEVKQSYLAQAINYAWYDGSRYRISSPNVIMLQYPNEEGWRGWSDEQINELFTFIQNTADSLNSAQPVWLGPVYPISRSISGSFGMAWAGMNYSFAQWAYSGNLANKPEYINSLMGTFLLDGALADCGPQLSGDYKQMVEELWGNGALNLWYYECRGVNRIDSVWGSNTQEAEDNFHIQYAEGNTTVFTMGSNSKDPIASWIAYGYEGTTYNVGVAGNPSNWYSGIYTSKPGFVNVATFNDDDPNTIAIGYYKNDTTSNFLLTHLPSHTGLQSYQQILSRDIINKMLYWVSDCPIEASESLIDLKVFTTNNGLLIPMTNQKDIGNQKSPNGTITCILNINSEKLNLDDPALYKIYWASQPSSPISFSRWDNVSVTFSGMVDNLVIERK